MIPGERETYQVLYFHKRHKFIDTDLERVRKMMILNMGLHGILYRNCIHQYQNIMKRFIQIMYIYSGDSYETKKTSPKKYFPLITFETR